ncbi:anti-sigma factor family protein [Actinoallomurus iriomotensis]|uniref:RNA polymerase subunit sigma n=1 Tax=Actinoallomurus iriomotensis TaxID=478107 RepID=A0A9W6VMV3_9ACTN|nr:zf-HC2 domain-containing protein [Actinoallomurus iriomotensis]GLY74060.1 RNA polymerase subunit sigma [Actinoallomurus iriomotensis]
MSERVDATAAHTDVGAYALGLLEEDDRRAFEAHLTGCDRCARELGEFAGMRELLSGVAPPEDDDRDPPSAGRAGGPGELSRLLRRRGIDERRRRRGTTIIGLVAGAALLAGGAAVGASVTGSGDDHGDVPADLLAWGEIRRATDPRTGVAGVVAMEDKGWGTHIALDLTHVTGPRTCELIAVSTTGARHVMTEWVVPRAGYGTPGAPDHLQVHGGTALRRSDLRRFEVRDQNDGILLVIPVQKGPGWTGSPGAPTPD